MRSWVFRNRRRLERIYGRRLAGSSHARPPGTSGPLLDDESGAELSVYVLYPRRSRILPAA